MVKKNLEGRFRSEFSITPNSEYFTPTYLFLTPTFWNVSIEKYSYFFWKVAFLLQFSKS